MAFVDQIQERDATGALKRVYDAATSRAGGVANIIKVMSQHGPVAQSSMQFYVSLMQAPSPLSRTSREMLATVVSNANGCFY